MATEKVSRAEFFEKTAPLFAKDHSPTHRELAKATGLSVSGVQYKLAIYKIDRKVRYQFPEAIR